MADAEITYGPVDDSDPWPEESVLDRDPIRLVGEAEAGKPGEVKLTFEGTQEGIWQNQWTYQVDKFTAAAIKKYCADCEQRGAPVYRQVILRMWNQPNN